MLALHPVWPPYYAPPVRVKPFPVQSPMRCECLRISGILATRQIDFPCCECRQRGSSQSFVGHQCELANVRQPRLSTMAPDSLALSNNELYVQEITTMIKSLNTAQELSLYE